MSSKQQNNNKTRDSEDDEDDELKDLPENPWAIKIPEFKPEDNPHGLVAESSFACLFPKYREKYLTECWPLVKKALEPHHIKAELNILEGSMTVTTTRKTWDPYIILKARDMIKLLARSVPYEQAVKILQDDMFCEVVKIGSLVRKKDKFIKRRQRIVGPNGATLKAIELLTDCYVLVHGTTVSIIGPYKGIQHVKKIVEDCMKNIHPVYNIKRLMIMRELAKDPKLRNENWERFLPKYPKKNQTKRKKPKKVRKKGEYTPFPPPPQPSKIDQQIESGEYFMSDAQKRAIKLREKLQRNLESEKVRQERRQKSFIPPEEKRHTSGSLEKPSESAPVDISKLKRKVKRAKAS